MKKDDRNTGIDLIKTVCMIFVIMIHTPLKPFESNLVAGVSLLAVLFVSNGLFYLVSGKLNLAKEFHSAKDIKQFYKKRLVSIILPYLLVCIGLSFVDMMLKDDRDWSMFFQFTYKNIMSDNVSLHLWFMYYLVGFLLSTPFVSKFLHACDKDELKILFWLAIGWNVFYVYLTTDLGITFWYRGFILEEYAVLYVLGYLADRIVDEKNEKFFYIAGVIGFVISIAGKSIFKENFFFWVDLHPGYIFFILAVYRLIDRKVRIKNAHVKKFLSFNAKYSFLIFLLHYHIMLHLAPLVVKTQIGWLNFLESTAFTYVVAMASAILLENLVLRHIRKATGRLLKV